MALITCPQCKITTMRAGFPVWAIIVAIVFFPIGLLALLAGRKPTKCHSCGNYFVS